MSYWLPLRQVEIGYSLSNELVEKGGKIMKLAYAELPKLARGNRKPVDEKVLAEILADIDGSVDFAPHSASDGKEYKTYKEAVSEGNAYKRAVGESQQRDPRWIRSRVFNRNGEQDREKPGKWVFTLSQRSTPPPEPKSKQDGATAEAA